MNNNSNSNVTRREILQKGGVVTGGVVFGVSAVSNPALAKKGGSGVFGGTYHAREPFTLTFWDTRVPDIQSCMSGNSAETTYQPYFLNYKSESGGIFLAMPLNVAQNLDTSETFEFVSRTQCQAEGDEGFSRVRFRRSK